MTAVVSECVQCNAPMEVALDPEQAPEMRCPRCDSLQVQYVYPLRREAPEGSAAAVAIDAGATCFFHETSGAAHICEDCGRYVCPLCTLALPLPASKPPGFPSHVCPTCFAHRTTEEEQGAPWDLYRTEYPRYDFIAHILFLAPMAFVLTFVFTPVTTPVALFIILRNWSRCRNPVTRFRLSLSFAILFHLAVILIWVLIFAAVLASIVGV